ncbi:MAG TPA: tRNA (N6-threonylcarbamoyladenosine(37)-N6)-methyltransferase TrmO, partial [Pseudolabrys sp.]
MTNKDFGVREGELAVELPARPDAGLYFIGRIHTPWKERKHCPKNAR